MVNKDQKEPEDIFEGLGQDKSTPEKKTKKNEKLRQVNNTKDRGVDKKNIIDKLKKSSFFDFRLSKIDWTYIGVLFLIGLVLDGIIIISSLQKLNFQSDIKVNFNHDKIVENEISPNNQKVNIILDKDKDGLLDKREKELGTSLLDSDTDQDGLTDFEEVEIYLTDPLKKDTDGDGLIDGKEVGRGLDPNDPDPNAKLFDIKSEINK